jgi:hypothetical protein
VRITIVGIETADDGTTRNVTIEGVASLTGLSVGGGPMPGGPGVPGVPIHPIWGPPGITLPPGPGFPPVAGHPLPIPPIPTEPPDNPDVIKPPPPDGGWGWSPEFGWGYFPGGGGKPQPTPPKT